MFRLCVAAYNHDEHWPFTAALTIRRISYYRVIAVAAIEGLKLYIHNVINAYVMSRKKL